MYKYEFVCEYTKIAYKPFKQIFEYDHEPSEEELEQDYREWLCDFIVGDFHPVEN